VAYWLRHILVTRTLCCAGTRIARPAVPPYHISVTRMYHCSFTCAGEITGTGIAKPDTWEQVVCKDTGLLYYWSRRTGKFIRPFTSTCLHFKLFAARKSCSLIALKLPWPLTSRYLIMAGDLFCSRGGNRNWRSKAWGVWACKASK